MSKDNNIQNNLHCLGNGEVESSILSRSTSKSPIQNNYLTSLTDRRPTPLHTGVGRKVGRKTERRVNMVDLNDTERRKQRIKLERKIESATNGVGDLVFGLIIVGVIVLVLFR